MSEVQHLLDGVDLETLVDTITAIDTDLPLIGDDSAVPYRPGARFERRTVGVGSVMLGCHLDGTDGSGDDSVAVWLEKFRVLKAFVWRPDTPRTLTRRTTLPDASVVEASAVCTHPSLPKATKVGPKAATTVLTFDLLDGYLYGTGDITVTSPGTITVAGDARTAHLIVTMAAGTLTNVTTGAAVTYTGTGTASIDVLAGTAAAGGVDVTAHVSWPVDGHDFYFDLDPGSNLLTGTATITYRPAYLP